MREKHFEIGNRGLLSTGRNSGFRRLLALACAACLALLQCCVVMPALTEQVYAAEGLLVTAEYPDGSIASRSLSQSFITENVSSTTVTIKGTEEGEEAREEEGYSLGKILSAAGLSGVQIRDLSKSGYVVFLDGETVYAEKTKVGPEELMEIHDIFAETSKEKVSFSKKPSSNKSNPKVGDTITIKYKLKVDKFYKHSDEYSDDDLTLTWESENGRAVLKSDTSTGTSGSIKAKVKKAGSITISPSSDMFPDLTDGVSVTLKGEKLASLIASPSSVTIYTGRTTTVSVRDSNGSSLTSGEVKWKSSNSKVAKVSSSGLITGVKKGTATITVTSKASASKGQTAKVKVTVTESTTRNNAGHYTPYRPTTRSGGVVNGTTASRPGTTTTTATRPTETAATMAPSFQTIQVKEVYLTPTTPEEEEIYYDENGNPIEDDSSDDPESNEQDWDEDGVSIPAAAGSAAAAAAVCGAGAVGRVRRFRRDMGGAVAAAATAVKAAADGRKKFLRGKGAEEAVKNAEDPAIRAGKGTEGSASAVKASGTKAEAGRKSRNPLNKFRK